MFQKASDLVKVIEKQILKSGDLPVRVCKLEKPEDIKRIKPKNVIVFCYTEEDVYKPIEDFEIVKGITVKFDEV